MENFITVQGNEQEESEKIFVWQECVRYNVSPPKRARSTVLENSENHVVWTLLKWQVLAYQELILMDCSDIISEISI